MSAAFIVEAVPMAGPRALAVSLAAGVRAGRVDLGGDLNPLELGVQRPAMVQAFP